MKIRFIQLIRMIKPYYSFIWEDSMAGKAQQKTSFPVEQERSFIIRLETLFDSFSPIFNNMGSFGITKCIWNEMYMYLYRKTFSGIERFVICPKGQPSQGKKLNICLASNFFAAICLLRGDKIKISSFLPNSQSFIFILNFV